MTSADYQPSIEADTEVAPAATGTTPYAGTTYGDRVRNDADVDFRSRWEAIQYGFVDDPRSAVENADTLVGEVLVELSAAFEQQRRQLEGQWGDEEPDTEELRTALRQYRDFFDRLLTI